MRESRTGIFFLLAVTIAGTLAAQPNAAPSKIVAKSDGQRDFDFEIGTWKTHVKRLQRPLTGSTAWVEYDGTSVVSQLVGGRANIVELDITGPAGTIRGVSLRLYDPETRQWSLNYASASGGGMTAPVVGGFRDGRGEFYGPDMLGKRAILVRFIITCANADTCRFEQSFSGDGGKHWELNWIATDTRVSS